MRNFKLYFSLFSTLLFSLSACDRGKNRLEEHPVPNPMIRENPKFIRGDALAGNFSNVLTSARLVAADAGKILRRFVYSGTAEYLYRKGEKLVHLREQFSLRQNRKGEFQFILQNNRDKGVEVIWTGGKLYFRWRYRPFRVVSNSGEDAARWQKLAVGRWRAAVELFGPSLILAQVKRVRYLGRDSVVYQVALNKSSSGEKFEFAKGNAWEGFVGEKGRGDAAKLSRIPLSANGEVWIDLETGLPLKVRFVGKYKIGRSKPPAIAEMRLKMKYGNLSDEEILPPKGVVEISQVRDPLDPFSGKRKPFFMLPPPKDE